MIISQPHAVLKPKKLVSKKPLREALSINNFKALTFNVKHEKSVESNHIVLIKPKVLKPVKIEIPCKTNEEFSIESNFKYPTKISPENQEKKVNMLNQDLIGCLRCIHKNTQRTKYCYEADKKYPALNLSNHVSNLFKDFEDYTLDNRKNDASMFPYCYSSLIDIAFPISDFACIECSQL